MRMEKWKRFLRLILMEGRSSLDRSRLRSEGISGINGVVEEVEGSGSAVVVGVEEVAAAGEAVGRTCASSRRRLSRLKRVKWTRRWTRQRLKKLLS